MFLPSVVSPSKPPTYAQALPVCNQHGMSYLFVMILIVIINISLMGVTQQWSVIMKRDKEAELLFRGTRIKEAIERFVADYEIQKATRTYQWPRKLEDLTKKNPKRYLQVVYKDPMTGQPFDLIKVGEEIHGVRSTSTDTPYNLVKFKGAKTYQAIRFESTGSTTGCQPNPLNPLTPTCSTPPAGQPPLSEAPSDPSQPPPSAPPAATAPPPEADPDSLF
ncbi:MAG: hypothetical protein AB7P17_04375 [Nitrospirales bacterium]